MHTNNNSKEISTTDKQDMERILQSGIPIPETTLREWCTSLLQEIKSDGPYGRNYINEQVNKIRRELQISNEDRWDLEQGLSITLEALSETQNELKWYSKEIHWIQGRYVEDKFISLAIEDKGQRARNYFLAQTTY
ncbi:hypothetical protein [Paenibacillus periandrae]|uniref:hypothetical protein n=1 Tax=Paenibacillus periandrae TaxID=1761741 RepID=UPI001F096104|nr:hypothetical protein [Paenibacillus periandrae]